MSLKKKYLVYEKAGCKLGSEKWHLALSFIKFESDSRPPVIKTIKMASNNDH